MHLSFLSLQMLINSSKVGKTPSSTQTLNEWVVAIKKCIEYNAQEVFIVNSESCDFDAT